VTPFEIFQKCASIPTWLLPEEKLKLAELAIAANRPGGVIVEVGSLYGGSSAILALGAPDSTIYSHDDFSWSPLTQASPAQVRENLYPLGIKNVEIIEGDSRVTAASWDKPIDLLWIDGGHSYEFVMADLRNLGNKAQVIAIHDFVNPAHPDVRRAVEEFLEWDKDFKLDVVVVSLAVLRAN
jgi:predicted O-methyltransferase YrrM